MARAGDRSKSCLNLTGKARCDQGTAPHIHVALVVGSKKVPRQEASRQLLDGLPADSVFVYRQQCYEWPPNISQSFC